MTIPNDLYQDLLDYFDDKADVDEGIGNEEMGFYTRLKEVESEAIIHRERRTRS